MTPVAAAGVALTLVGVGLLGWVIAKARRLRRAAPDRERAQAELRTLIALNFAAVALSFLGLGVVLVGLLL